jgi:uncharacterized membrane protein YccF (DUF307 family)
MDSDRIETTHTFVSDRAPNLLLRVAWFVLVGWWLGGILSGVAWFLNATVIGLPAGLWLINRLPTFITLRPQERRWVVDGGELLLGGRPAAVAAARGLVPAGRLVALRVWLAVAYVMLVSIVGLPLAFWMYGRIGAVTTLYRS